MDKKTMFGKILRGVEIGCLAVLAVRVVTEMASEIRCMRCSCEDGCRGCECDGYDGNPCHMTCAGMADEPDNQ